MHHFTNFLKTILSRCIAGKIDVSQRLGILLLHIIERRSAYIRHGYMAFVFWNKRYCKLNRLADVNKIIQYVQYDNPEFFFAGPVFRIVVLLQALHIDSRTLIEKQS